MNARRLPLCGLVLLCAVLAASLLTVAPALAASLETPELEVGSVKASEATFLGVLSPKASAPNGGGSYRFLYKEGSSACEGGSETTPGVALGTAHEELPAELVSGLAANTEYTVCLVEESQEGTVTSAPVPFRTEAARPTVGEESASDIGSSSAALQAKLNPNGAPTKYRFEYATEAEYAATKAYGSQTALQSAGAGSETVSVLATLERLAPETAYHFRLVASNAKGEAEGVDGTFSTFPVGVLGLPDKRGYELVSSLENGDSTVVLSGPVRAAADGSALAYRATPPPVGGNGNGEVGGNGASTQEGDNEYLAQRSASGGWTATDIQPDGLKSASYRAFSSDLSVAILGSSEPLTESVTDTPEGFDLYSRSASDGNYQPFGAGGYAGMAADGSQMLFQDNVALQAGTSMQTKELDADFKAAAEEKEKLDEEANTLEAEGEFSAAELKRQFARENVPSIIYDSVGGELSLVGVLPDGAIAPQTSFFSFGPSKISVDGSRIFWATSEVVKERFEVSIRLKALYVRENGTQPQSPLGANGECIVPADACTVQVDASTLPGTEQEKAEKGGGGVFQAASSDGSRVFFTDETPLTSDSTAAAGKPDLYEYDVSREIDTPGTLTDLTVDAKKEPADVVGILGASKDGSYVYFAAAAALTADATSQACLLGSQPAEEGTKCNIYVDHEGEVRLVATVLATDGNGGAKGNVLYGGAGDWAPNLGSRSSYVTADGRHLVFISSENLTAFDSKSNREIYIYDFGSGISCVSCNPDGAPTFLESSVKENEASSAQAELPESGTSAYSLRDLSADGDRVFFNAREGLVTQDTNGLTDVYEWERSGSGSCEREKGCLYLLSGGTSTDVSGFLDAGESGEDVFIATRAQLVARDHGEVYEVYDARVGAPQEPTPPACTGSGCQGVPGVPPIFATPSSVTFNGVGNFPPPVPATKSKPKPRPKSKSAKCRNESRKRDKHGKCAKHVKKSGNVKARKASYDRRSK